MPNKHDAISSRPSPTDCTAPHSPRLLGADFFFAIRAGERRPENLRPEAESAATSAPKAKSVIQLFMNGGPSQVDLFDPKPTLKRLGRNAAQPGACSFAISNGKVPGRSSRRLSSSSAQARCGMEISDALPHIAKCADDIALIRSMYGEHANHEPALFLMHTGGPSPAARRSGRVGRPTDSARRIRTCRRTWCLTIRRVCRSTASPTGSPLGCRRSIRERAFARKVARC